MALPVEGSKIGSIPEFIAKLKGTALYLGSPAVEVSTVEGKAVWLVTAGYLAAGAGVVDVKRTIARVAGVALDAVDTIHSTTYRYWKELSAA